LWFFDKDKKNTDRKDMILFIDARKIFTQIDRAHREFMPEQIEFIANIVRLYRGEDIESTHGSEKLTKETFPKSKYQDIVGLCKFATLKEIEEQGWSLNPGRYVGVVSEADDGSDFKERLEELNEELEVLNTEARKLEESISINIRKLIEK
jgi:type I restriction enzyme M protein